jgi:hypothetical protein
MGLKLNLITALQKTLLQVTRNEKIIHDGIPRENIQMDA